MLVILGIILLTLSGDVLSESRRPHRRSHRPPPCEPEPSCAKHQHYTVNNTTCIKTCANRLVPPSNSCKPYTGCVCDPGYMRFNDDATGPCVTENKCPPVCPKNEHYVRNYPQCQRTCGNRLVSGGETCKSFSGCICNEGFIRKYDNASGICIPEEQCPPIPTKCGVNEEPTSCRIFCPPQTCDSIFTSYYCLPTDCEPGCDCLDGFLRDSDGVCIPSEDCFKTEPIECGPYEEPSDCAISCPPQSCESLYVTYLCAEPHCSPGCNCIKGYLRNGLGECIPSEECATDPSLCNGDENATRTTDCSSPCQSTCAEPDKYHEECIDVCILNSCECQPGFILSDTDGVCIDPEDCPGGSPACGANETYSPCKFGCPTLYCPQDDSLYMVACSPPYPCRGGCMCKSGYLLESYENPSCILASDCRPVECTRQNEEWDPNPSSCFLDRCEDRGTVCDYYYPTPPRCVCKEGFYRNSSDICVPVSECPQLGCGGDLNATYTDCSSACPTTCADLLNEEDLYCPTVCGPSNCECKPGYVLTEDGGQCIDPKDCPDQSDCGVDPNAEYRECPSPCQPTCTNPRTDQPCVKMCLAESCVCKEGYLRIEEEVGCNGDRNATYTDCTSACPLTCADQDPNKICPAICNPPGCQCNPGYVLTAIGGQCISPEDCPADPRCKGDVNATFSECPSACQPTCDSPNADVPCTEQCMPPGCVCKERYLLNKPKGICIKPQDCPGGSPKCGVNETYVNCNVDCGNSFCPVDDSLAIILCDPPYPCPGGCACKPGYLLLSENDKRCVRSSECAPVTCTRDNEIWDPEPTNCRQERCDNRHTPCDFPYPLPPQCVCIKGYYRNQDDICVPEWQCPDYGCGGDANAMFSECPSSCQLTCRNPRTDQICINKKCQPPGCVCKPGYVLNEETGLCVDPEYCPGLGCNGDLNATYTECTSACPRTCADQNPGPCILVCYPPGCQCNPGYVLNEDGVCIIPEDCPEDSGCEGDINAEFSECPSSCEPTCANTGTDQVCDKRCQPPGCVCKSGYVRDEENGKCVKPENCPGLGCNGDHNATYTECTSACPLTCADPDPRPCILICYPPGCECNPGYVLNEITGKCISPEDCPEDSGCEGDINAEFSECPSSCEPTCANTGTDQVCDKRCQPPGCVCKSGYVRDEENGKCVKPENCPGLGCNGDHNATYTECTSACPLTCADPDPRPCILICYPPGCECNPGYVLNEITGKCISPEDCPEDSGCEGDINAEFSECPSSCEPTCANTGTDQVCDKRCQPPGCVCKSGYVRDEETGKCVKPENCPGLGCNGDHNATYTECTSACPLTCADPDPRPCILICYPPGCECNPGYVLNEITGKCISPEDCPEDSGCEGDINAEFSECPSSCEPTCANTGTDQVCDKRCQPPGCVCKSGYVRDEETGKCVKPENCPGLGCNGDHNATYTECTSACPLTCADPDPRLCILICYPPGCECNPGYVLNEITGKCISPEDCPGKQETPSGAFLVFLYL